MPKGRPSKHWKAVEQETARFFGSRRTPLSGSNSGHATNSDSLHPRLFIETKFRMKHAAVALYLSSLPLARAEKKTLVIALKQHHQSRRKKIDAPPFLVVLDPRDIIKVAKLLEEKQECCPCQTKQRRLRPKM